MRTKKWVIVLKTLFYHRTFEYVRIDLLHFQMLNQSLFQPYIVLNTVLVGHPSELLKNTSVLFQDFTVDLAVVRCYLGVQIGVLNFYFQIVRHCKGCNLVWEISYRVKGPDSEGILDHVLLFVGVFVEN